MASMDDAERVHPEDWAAWREWLDAHHASSPGVWLVTWRKAAGRPTLAYGDAVEEALAVGWVDSKGGKLDELRTMLWFTARKRGSGWSRPNKERVERLEREGRMGEAGRAVVEAARADGSWSALDAVEDLVVPDDLTAALAEAPPAAERWEAFPRSARRGILEWISTAKRPETRRRRVLETATLAARGVRANQWRRPS